MDWLRQVAAQLREWLAQQAWLDGWQTTIEATPDWALVAAGPGALLLLTILLFVQAPRGKRAVKRPDKVEAQSASAASPPPQRPAPVVSATPTARRADPPPAVVSAAGQSASSVRRASGVPDANEQERKARVFLSSTFRDMRAEREVLATDTFPSLKRKFRARGVEVQEVDLRWGVNEGDATLDVCLQAVRRSNWFVGLIGQRYGTTLEDQATVAQLGPDYPAVADGLGRSVTEIEILEGVLLNAKNDKEMLFFERDPAWLETLSPSEREEYEDQHSEAQAKLAGLKARIRARVGAMHAYPAPAEIGGVFMEMMSEALERAFPPIEDGDDPFMQEHRLHAAYARERLGLYVGGDDYIVALNAGVEGDGAPQLVVGDSGGGKSALIANWVQRWRAAHPRDIIFAHYLGASPESASPSALVRRLWRHLNAVTGDDGTPPNVDATLDELRDAMLDRLGQANAFAVRENCRIVIALDGLDKLADEHRDLRWWPRALPPRVRLVASSLDGKAREAGRERGWSERPLKPFDVAQQGRFIAETLRAWNKSDFPKVRKQRVLAHAMAGLPLFLKTILEELRVSAADDVLDARLDDYLKALKMPDLYARILAQFESECGKDFVCQALSLIWASRAGLEEDEIVAIASKIQRIALGPAGLAWERLRNRLADNLRDSQGRVAFSHDYLRQAVEEMYLRTEDAKQRAHLTIADRFAAREPDERQAEELPHQLRAAEAWDRLEALLVDLDRFELLRTRGDAELLSYWLPLKERGRDPETLLCTALEARVGEAARWTEDDVVLASLLCGFLDFAGAFGASRARLQQQLTVASERLFGPDHPNVANGLNNLAELYRDTNRYAEAEPLYKRALAIDEKSFGLDHPNVASDLNNLALLYGDTNRHAEAEPLHKRALAIDEASFGLDHPDVARGLNNLAGLYRATNRHTEAEPLYLRALAIDEASLGPDHPSVASRLNNLAELLQDTNRHAEAEALYKRALAIDEASFGPDHPNVARDLNNLAELYRDTNRYAEAEPLYERALVIFEASFGPDHPNVATGLNNLALLYHVTNRHAEAEALYQRALGIDEASFGPNHPSVASRLNNLAGLYGNTNRYAEAEPLYQRALAIFEASFGLDHPNVAIGLNNLASLYQDTNRYAEAEALYKRALAIDEASFGLDHPNVATGLNNIAGLCGDTNRYAEAEPLYQRALVIFEASFGPDHPNVATGLNNLALLYHVTNRHAEAEPLYQRALAILRNSLGSDHPDTRMIAENLAACVAALKAQGKR